MWHLVQKPKVIKATHENACLYRDTKPVKCDRGVKKPILNFLRSEIRAGNARPFDISLCWCDEDGELYRVNGKHSSIAVAEYLADGAPGVKSELYFNVSEYKGETYKDVVNLYRSFDRRGQSRSSDDVYLATASTDPDLSELPRSLIKAATSAIDFATSDAAACSHYTPEERADRMLNEKAFVLHLNTILNADKEGSKSTFQRVPVAAAIYSTFKKDRLASTEFWTLVKNERAERSCPTRDLARKLETSVIVRTGKENKEKSACGRIEMYALCLKAWNAWRKKRPIRLQYRIGEPLPKAI